MEDTEALPNYPYRDDALLIFEVIHDYVREVLEAFYGTLRNWVLNLFAVRTENEIKIGVISGHRVQRRCVCR